MTQNSAPRARTEEQTRRILQAVDAHFDAQLAFTQDLVRFPSLREQEHTAQDFLYEAMRQRGFAMDRWKIDVEDIRSHPGFGPVTVSYENAFNVVGRSEEHTSELQSLMRISYAVFCLTKKHYATRQYAQHIKQHTV